jgi:hypothetical protein
VKANTTTSAGTCQPVPSRSIRPVSVMFAVENKGEMMLQGPKMVYSVEWTVCMDLEILVE